MHNQTQDFYEKYFDQNSYDSFKYDVGAYCTRTAIRNQIIPKKGAVLEIGIGLMSLLEELQMFECFGIDIAEKTIEKTSKLFKEKNLRGHFLKANAEKLPFSDNTFDLIITSHVFEHLENDEQAFQEACRVLKPGGQLIIFVPGSLDGKAPIGEWETCRHYRNYNLQEMRRLEISSNHKLQLNDISYPHKMHNLIWNRAKHLVRWINYPLKKWLFRDNKGIESRPVFQYFFLPMIAALLDTLDQLTRNKETYLLGTKFNVLAIFKKVC